MDFRILALLMVSLALTQGTPQRALNSLHGSQSVSPAKLSSESAADDPKKAKIMKQINKVNDDGSYTFGYEADDGSFRVETRSKDGVVKGKYGYVDANGQLKVMEYTAGEKVEGSEPSESEEDRTTTRPIPSPIPQQYKHPKFIARSTKQTASVALPPRVPQPQIQQAPQLIRQQQQQDQTFAAQTPTQVTQVKYNRDEDEDKSSEDESPKDVNNGQYFRALTPQQGAGQNQIQNQGPGAGSPRQQQQQQPQFIAQRQGQEQGGEGEGPRYIPTHQLDLQSIYGQSAGPQQFNQQQPFQYAGPQGGQGPPSPSQFQGFSQGPQAYRRPIQLQGGPGSQSQQNQGQIELQSPYQGQFDEESFGQTPQGQGQPQFGRDPNVQIQFRGSPPDVSDPSPTQGPQQGQSQPLFPGQGPQQFTGFGSSRQFGGPGSARQLSLGGQSQGSDDSQYVPNLDLDGFSEDADEDGYVDEQPNNLGKGSNAQAQEKQGVAVKAVGAGRQPVGGDAYRPQVLGPQGVLQGGRINIGREQQQPGQGGQSGIEGPGQFPQLTEEQIAQLFSQQPQSQYQQGIPQGGQGQIPQQYLGQQGLGGGRQQFSGFPNSPQGFSQGQGQPQFINGPRPGQGQGGQPQFLGQQNPLLQPQYQGQGGQEQFSGGFPPQFLSQQGQGQGQQQFRPQGAPQAQQFLGQGIPQGQFLGQGGPQSQSQGFPGQFQGQGSPQLQSGGFPFEFNQFGNQGGQFQGPTQGQLQGQLQSQGGQFQGFSPAQLQALQGQGGQLQGLSQAQLQGLSGQGGLSGLSQAQLQGGQFQGAPQQQFQGGFPGGPGSFSPGRFPPSGAGQPQQVSQEQYLAALGQNEAPRGRQLGGGPPRPVQPAGSSSSAGNSSPGSPGSSLFGGEARKVATTSAAPKSN